MRILAEWKIAVPTNVFLPHFDINEKNKSSEAAIHEKFAQQQEPPRQQKIAAEKKSRVGKNTIFFICLLPRYKFRIREKTGIFPNSAECFSLQLFFRPATT